MSLTFRPAREPDLPVLAEIYRSAAMASSEYYTGKQLKAWAASADMPRFRHFILKPHTLVAENNDEITGFGGIEPDGHITALYVKSEWHRKGIGKALMQKLLDWGADQGVTRYHAAASFLSRGLFEHFGFTQFHIEYSKWNEVTFKRFWMEKVV